MPEKAITACSDGVSTRQARQYAEDDARHKAGKDACVSESGDKYDGEPVGTPIHYFQPEGKKGTNYWCVKMEIKNVICKQPKAKDSKKPQSDESKPLTEKERAKDILEYFANEISLLTSEEQDMVIKFVIEKVKEGLSNQKIVMLVEDKIQDLILRTTPQEFEP